MKPVPPGTHCLPHGIAVSSPQPARTSHGHAWRVGLPQPRQQGIGQFVQVACRRNKRLFPFGCPAAFRSRRQHAQQASQPARAYPPRRPARPHPVRLLVIVHRDFSSTEHRSHSLFSLGACSRAPATRRRHWCFKLLHLVPLSGLKSANVQRAIIPDFVFGSLSFNRYAAASTTMRFRPVSRRTVVPIPALHGAPLEAR